MIQNEVEMAVLGWKMVAVEENVGRNITCKYHETWCTF